MAGKGKSLMEAYAAGGSILLGSLILVGISSLCLHFALWIFNKYDRRAYIERKELIYNGDIFLHNFLSSFKQGYKW